MIVFKKRMLSQWLSLTVAQGDNFNHELYKPVYKNIGMNVYQLTEVGFLPIFLIAYYWFFAPNGIAGLGIIVGYR